MQGGDSHSIPWGLPPAPPKAAAAGGSTTWSGLMGGTHAGMQSGENGFDPMKQPTEFLTSVFDTIVATDKEGYFLRPVDESVAPNYYKIIQHPLCFADMREKLKAGSYTGYRSMMADFELIVSNARTFNKEKTKCHKCALTLQRNFTKIMSAQELGIRKAFSVLYPQGAPQAAPPAGGLAGTGTGSAPNLLDGSDFTSMGTSSAHGTGGHQGVAGTDIRDQAISGQPSIKAEPPPSSLAAAGPSHSLPLPPYKGKRPAALVPLPPAPPPLPIRLDPICKAYSDDEAEGEKLVLQYHRQLPEGAHGSRRRKQMPLETLLAEVRQAAVFRPFTNQLPSGGQQPMQPTAHGNGAGQQFEGTAVQGEGVEVLAAMQGRSSDWKQARRSIEWQCRWLELRMQELQVQIQRLGGEEDMGGASKLPQAPVADTGGSSSSVAASLQDRQKRLRTAASRHAQGGPSVPLLQPTASQSKLLMPIAHKPLASSTFFAGRTEPASTTTALTSTDPSQQPAIVPVSTDADMTDAAAPSSHSAGAATTAAAAMPALPATAGAGQQGVVEPVLLPPGLPGLCGLPGTQLPAAVFSALETLELQLLDVKRGLQMAFGLDRGRLRPGAARTGAMAILTNAAAGAMAANLGPHTANANAIKRQAAVRATPVQRAPSMAAGAMLLAGAYNKAIVIPPVRDLSEEDMEVREQAGTVWAEAYRREGEVALLHPPPLVAAALAECDDEGSSSEDTSDEAYARMHAIMAEEERKRFAAAAEGQRRRNKQSKTAAAAANAAQAATHGVGAAAAGGAQGDKVQGHGGPTRRPSVGIKAPRPVLNAQQIPFSPHVGPGFGPGQTAAATDAAARVHGDGTAAAATATTAAHAGTSAFAVPQPPAKTRAAAAATQLHGHAPTSHHHHTPHVKIPPIVTGIPYSTPAVVMVSAVAPTSTPAVATAPHPFRHTTSSLLPSLTIVPPSYLPPQPSTGAAGTATSLQAKVSSLPNTHAPSPNHVAPAVTPPPPSSTSHITTRSSLPRGSVTTPTGTTAPAPAGAAVTANSSVPPLPRRTSRRTSNTPVPRPTPSPGPSSSDGVVVDAGQQSGRPRKTRATTAAVAVTANSDGPASSDADGHGVNGDDVDTGSDSGDESDSAAMASSEQEPPSSAQLAEGDKEADEAGSGSGSGEEEASEEEEEGGSGSGSDEEGRSASSSSGASDADAEASDDEEQGKGEGAQSSDDEGQPQRRKAVVQKQTGAATSGKQQEQQGPGLARRSTGVGKLAGAAIGNGSSRNGKRVAEVGKVPARMTRSQDLGKLRSGSSRDQRDRRGVLAAGGGVVKPTRPSGGGVGSSALPKRR